MSSDKIDAIMIVEVLGKPKEYVVEILEEIVGRIDAEKGIKILDSSIKEPRELEKQKDFFTSFAEIEFEADEMLQIVFLVFKYMPSHIEIISPEQITTNNYEYTDILNSLTKKLHNYDEVARIIKVEKDILEKKLRGIEGKKEEKTKIPDLLEQA